MTTTTTLMTSSTSTCTNSKDDDNTPTAAASIVAPEAVTVLHPLLLEAETATEGKETSIIVAPDINQTDDQQKNNTSTLYVSLHRNHDFNAVIEYNKYSGRLFEEKDSTRQGVNVLLLFARSGIIDPIIPFEQQQQHCLPFEVCYQSDQLLTFVKAHIDPCATFARIYTKDAWNIRDECQRNSRCRKRWFFVFDSSRVSGLYGLVSGAMCSILIIVVIAFKHYILPGTSTLIYKRLGIKGRGIHQNAVHDTTNKYEFVLQLPHHQTNLKNTVTQQVEKTMTV